MAFSYNATTVAVLFAIAYCQGVMAAFSGRELLSGNHTGMKNFTGLDYLSIRLDTSSPINNIVNSASSDSTRGGWWKKYRKGQSAPQSRSGPSNNDGLLQGFDGDTQQLVPPVMNPNDLELLERKKDLFVGLAKRNRRSIVSKSLRYWLMSS